MRIMLDTNVLVSLLLFPNPQMNEMIENIFAEHQLVLSSFVVDELKEVVKRKFPSKIVEEVDIFITGDKDFAGIKLEKPEVLTPADFRDKYL